jgi:hypothetical protein
LVVWFGRSRQLEFFDSNMNVSINDIKEIGVQNDILLSEEQLHNVLSEYNRIVMDKAEGWEELIKHLMIKQTIIQILIEQNKE